MIPQELLEVTLDSYKITIHLSKAKILKIFLPMIQKEKKLKSPSSNPAILSHHSSSVYLQAEVTIKPILKFNIGRIIEDRLKLLSSLHKFWPVFLINKSFLFYLNIKLETLNFLVKFNFKKYAYLQIEATIKPILKPKFGFNQTGWLKLLSSLRLFHTVFLQYSPTLSLN